jgi:hypothetical protein
MILLLVLLSLTPLALLLLLLLMCRRHFVGEFPDYQVSRKRVLAQIGLAEARAVCVCQAQG